MKQTWALFFILTTAAFLRFYNLLWDSPYFFNPDERNMAGAISQFNLPTNAREIPACIISQLKIYNLQPTIRQLTDNVQPNCNLNPHFFAYGQFPLYLAYFTGIVSNITATMFHSNSQLDNSKLAIFTLSFPQAIAWLRIWSALSSTLTVLMVYFITKQLFDIYPFRGSALLSASFSGLLAAFTPGLIQAAHFGTTESMLTFFYMVIIFLSLKLINSKSQTQNLKQFQIFLLFSLTLGLALATKISALVFIAPFTVAFFVWTTKRTVKSVQAMGKSLSTVINTILADWMGLLSALIVAILFFVLFSPYNIINLNDFHGAINYEYSVASGASKVFYTRQFEQTAPILFQLEKIFPYALGLGLEIAGIVGIGISVIIVGKNVLMKRSIHGPILIVLISFFSYFLVNSIFFTKWTRFMTPIMPLFAVFAAIGLTQFKRLSYFIFNKFQISNFKFQINILGYCVIGSFLLISLLPGLAFFSIYLRDDVRVQASEWIYTNIPKNSQLLFETANVVDIPLGIPSYKIGYKETSFDFYHLDENPELVTHLIDELAKADYFFIPSRRIFANTLPFPQKYPKLYHFYELLFSGNLGFEEVATFTSYPRLTFPMQPALSPWEIARLNRTPLAFLGAYQTFFTHGYLPDESAEETWSVFDHPVVRIYKKVKPMSKEDYRNLLNLSL